MNIVLYMIRHGKTRGNAEGRYIGSTDEALSDQGIRALKELKNAGTYPACSVLYSSPMKRCVQSAELIYPGMEKRIKDGLKEYHFGIFEGKNYKELNGTADYQAFIDSWGETQIPGTAPLSEYRAACVDCFDEIVRELKDNGIGTAAIICHGGFIMAVMNRYAPTGDIYDYRVGNGEGYAVTLYAETGQFQKIERLGRTNT